MATDTTRDPDTDTGAAPSERTDGRLPRGDQELFAGPVARPDEYRLVAPRSRGGEGVVWRACYQGRLPQPVDFAIKQLVAPAGSDPSAWPVQELLDRWNEQLKLLHFVHHEHLVSYKEMFAGWPPHPPASCVGEPPRDLGTWYVVMDWVEGPSLHDLVKTRESSAQQLVTLIVQVAEAIDCLHSGRDTNGMVLLHRDIKPGNVIVHPTRGAVLVDYGLLRVDEPALTEMPAWTGPYLAPEVHADKTRTSCASDIWALAGTAFFALTGEHPSPFEPDLMRRQLHTAITGRVDRPELVGEAIMEVLDRSPDARPPNATAWTDRLRTAVGHGKGATTPARSSIDGHRNRQCGGCGFDNAADNRFCGRCGTDLIAAPAGLASRTREHQGTRHSVAAGWYAPEAGRPGEVRWWDGASWTAHIAAQSELENWRWEPVRPFRDPKGLAIALRVVFLVAAAAGLTGALMRALEFGLIADWSSNPDRVTLHQLRANFARVVAPWGIEWAPLVIGVGLLAIWAHIVYTNLPALGVRKLRFATGWAAGGFLVPVMNLFRPIQVLSDAWKAAEPGAPELDPAWTSRRGKPLIAFWLVTSWVTICTYWSTFPLANPNSLRPDANRRSAGVPPSIGVLWANSVAGLIGQLFIVVTAITGLRVISAITARQQLRAKEVPARRVRDLRGWSRPPAEPLAGDFVPWDHPRKDHARAGQTMTCPNGHSTHAGCAYCPECGVPIRRGPASLPELASPAGAEQELTAVELTATVPSASPSPTSAPIADPITCERGHQNPLGHAYCGQCGLPLKPAPSQPEPAALLENTDWDPDRRQVMAHKKETEQQDPRTEVSQPRPAADASPTPSPTAPPRSPSHTANWLAPKIRRAVAFYLQPGEAVRAAASSGPVVHHPWVLALPVVIPVVAVIATGYYIFSGWLLIAALTVLLRKKYFVCLTDRRILVIRVSVSGESKQLVVDRSLTQPVLAEVRRTRQGAKLTIDRVRLQLSTGVWRMGEVPLILEAVGG